MESDLMNSEWLSRLSQFKKLIVGFSGGLDSTVLLHVLASHPALFTKLVAVHVNHGISARASYWQAHCEQFCHHLGIPLTTQSVQFDRSANIEERARIARYAVFSSLMTEQSCLILGHHLDDQAETVLLQLFRGAGVDGLAAICDWGKLGLGGVARPFLNHSRAQLEHYAVLQQLRWIEDESNQDINYSRNYLRHQIMPLLKKKWPGVVGNIARTAIHCQQAKRNLDGLAEGDSRLISKQAKERKGQGDMEGRTPKYAPVDENLNTLSTQQFSTLDAVGNKATALEEYSDVLSNNFLLITPLKELSRDRLVNLLRVWLKNNRVQMPSTATFERLIDEVIFARSDAIPEVSWAEVIVRRHQRHLYLDRNNTNKLPSCIEWSAFPLPLVIADLEINLLAKKSIQGLVVPPNTKICVRFRQGGEEFFWHGQTKRLKKLFQEWGVPPWLRERIPLVYFNEALAAVVGYAMSDLFFSKESADAWIFAKGF
ncbi:tRNA lysidine(34) synthetase TilS [Legionella sp. PATHC035]|uniref:tRNA lysidine(34) synthetase TilS n=1 Tax=Legionella sp. PATHC035 TaxID=2992040 RepID=UPI0022434203|nr:tRNA lysidine(34) synthetase TilS [Legionella sp. PATHC035]MCW8407988.1 tRNA lysidine(34) synthetase TilS [Legionella sp. PATHC035]